MPEGPEVETVRRVLENWCKGRKIEEIECYFPLMLHNTNVEELKDKLVGKTIDSVDKKGKILIFNIGDYCLLSHLAMEGKYHFYDEFKGPQRHIHVVFKLDNGYLVYHDTRKFGRMYLFSKEDAYRYPPLSALGPDPIGFKDYNYLEKIVKKSNKTIKEVLTDQNVFSGIGNIYVDEICFASHILPYRIANTITADEVKLIIDNASRILSRATELGGSSVHSFTSGNDVDGKFQNEIKMYGRGKELCYDCGSVITKMEIGGRGTCFCSNCQNKINKKNPRVIGVTGLIGSGKSKVALEIFQNDFTYISADQIGHEAYENAEVLKAVEKVFPSAFANNKLDKSVLRNLINKDVKEKKKLEDIVHPFVIDKIKKCIGKSGRFVLEVPLLFETNIDEICDMTIFVNCENSVRVKRLKERNPNYKEFSNLNNNPEVQSKKIRMSDYVIDNSLDFENTKKQIKYLFNKIF